MWNPFKKKKERLDSEAPTPSPGRTETVLYAFVAQGPAGFPGSVVSLTSDEELKDRIRKEANGPGLDVVIVPAEDWKAPTIQSLNQQGLGSVFPVVMDRATAYMAKVGLPRKDPQELIRTGAVMPHPMTGLVFFVYRVERPMELKEQDSPNVEEWGESGPENQCQFCGKEIHEGSGTGMMSVPVSVDEDPFEAMQKAAAEMLAVRKVCPSCAAVFCLECGRVEGEKHGKDLPYCPECSQLVPS